MDDAVFTPDRLCGACGLFFDDDGSHVCDLEPVVSDEGQARWAVQDLVVALSDRDRAIGYPDIAEAGCHLRRAQRSLGRGMWLDATWDAYQGLRRMGDRRAAYAGAAYRAMGGAR